MKQLKYIVTKDDSAREIIPGYVEFHADLVKPGIRCVGGGLIYVDTLLKRITLRGRSVDYGPVSGKDLDLSLKGKRKEFAKKLYDVWKEYDFGNGLGISETEFINFSIVIEKNKKVLWDLF